MIAVGGVLLSDEVIEENFVCDLLKCKGGCCVDGDCGAPLTKEETKTIAKIYQKIKSYLSAEDIAEVEKQGTHVMDDEYGYVTPTINGGICVYAYTDELGIVKCAIEKAYNDGVVDFKKPISCHLYPIRIKQLPGYEAVNYEPRPTLCRPACKQGNKLKVPVYKFLKEPIIRKFGEDFYKELDAVAIQYRKHKGL